MSLRELSKLIQLKPEPQTTPSLSLYTQRSKAVECVSEYYLTPALRAHFKRVFECVLHRQGQGFWVQAEYGAGKTHFLCTLIDLLMWHEEGVWPQLRDEELKKDYAGPMTKARMFPVAFSLRGMGESDGKDSLMRIFEEQIRESLESHDPELAKQVKLTSAEIADEWYANDASGALKAAAAHFFEKEHRCTAAEYRSKNGVKKFGQELVRSEIVEGRLKGKFKDRFTYIYEQITKLGKYDGILFVVDEFRSWQDRHTEGTTEYAEDEEILETLAFVLPTNHLNVLTIIASQGDMPQKLSGGGQGDRFMPLYLLADKSKGEFGEIVTFRCRDLLKGAGTDIKDYYDHCRKEYRFIKQGNISLEYFSSIFPFQPRTFDVMQRITQSDDKNNLPTARSAIRMAWQTLSDAELFQGNRLVILSDIIRSDELRKGMNHEIYRDDYQGLQTAIDQLSEMDGSPEEHDQARRVLETMFLWAMSLPDNLRDGLTAQEVAEAAWLMDLDVGATAQAEHLLTRLIQDGFPIRSGKKTKDGKEVVVYSYETTAAQDNPSKFFAPLKKKAKEDTKAQDQKWNESLFWQLADMTPEAQQELGVDGGILSGFQPPDQRTAQDKLAGKPAQYPFPYKAASSTKRIHKTQYSGEVIVADHWRAEFGDAIKNPDQHFRLVYLTKTPEVDEAKLTAALQDVRIAVCHPDSLSEGTREALADLIAAEQLKRSATDPKQTGLRDYAENKRREALKTILKCQLDEFRRGKVQTQKGYGIPATEIFKLSKEREADLGGRLIEKAYDMPLFSPKDLKKEFTDNDAKKLFAGLFHKDAVKAEKDAVVNFGVGLELTVKSHPDDFKPDAAQALTKIRSHIGGRTDVPLNELKSAFCATPYGLTESMVVLYLCALVKAGGYELALNASSPVTLFNEKPLVGNRLTTHTLALCDWNAKLEKALLGARLIVSQQKGWDEVLPYARVLDDTLKPAATPDDEPVRNEQLLATLGKLKTEVPAVQKSLETLASKLAHKPDAQARDETREEAGRSSQSPSLARRASEEHGVSGAVPKPLVEICTRLIALASVTSFQEFDAAVRESYPNKDDFAASFEQYGKGRRLRDRAFDLSSAKDYLNGACELEKLEFDRKALVGYLNFDTLLTNPDIIGARMEEFEKWKSKYTQAYRKAHRSYYEQLTTLEAETEALRPQVRALDRMNAIAELGPPPHSSLSVAADLAAIDRRLDVCVDAAEASVNGTDPKCSKCGWAPTMLAPAAEVTKLKSVVTAGLADRLQRFKDAAIGAILKQAAEKDGRADLAKLLEIIQVATADSLAGVMTDDLVEFLRKLLYDENLIQEEVPLGPIVQQVGAIEEDHIDEAIERFAKLLSKAVKEAKSKHGKAKRVRVFLRLQGPTGEDPH